MSSRDSREERVLGALLDTLYSQSIATGFAAVLVVALFTAFQWDRQPPSRLLPWLLLQSAPIVIGQVSGFVYQRRAPAGIAEPRKWLKLYLANLITLSGAWGLGTLLFFDARDSVGGPLSVVFSAGVTAGALLGASCYPLAFVAFALLALVPSIVLCLLAGDHYTTIGGGVIAFLLFSLAASRNLHASFRKSSELRFENQDLAERLQREKERAEQALAAKSKVLAAASHDLRQPLHALGMFVELLDERLKGGEERVFLSRIRASSSALTGLLNALLDLSRLDSASIAVRREHFRLGALFEQLAAEYAEIARRKGLEFRVTGAELVVESDLALLARMVRNFLSNAVRFTTAGQIALTARQVGDRVELSVADTGAGIAPSDQEKIFQEFYQVGNAERDREQGLGLGLAIVRGLGRILDHPIVVHSRPERSTGSEFVIRLPAGDAETAEQDEALASSQSGAQSIAGRRILIVDDERDIRDGVSALLRSWGCQPCVAGGLEEALLACEQEVPDVVLCDYRLRGATTGTELLDQLEARFGSTFTSVIITGDTSPERIRQAESGGRPVLFKPVVPGKLRALLNALLQQSSVPPDRELDS